MIVTGERARDGDYGLNDVGALRANPFHAARDFEGIADRDVFGTTIHVRRTAGRWFLEHDRLREVDEQDVTDLDYTPRPLIKRDNTENDLQFTQEFRVASPEPRRSGCRDSARLRWQAGVFLFTRTTSRTRSTATAVTGRAMPSSAQHSPKSALDDTGVGLFGQATVTFSERLDLRPARASTTSTKSATLQTFFDPPIAPASHVDAEKSFSNVSPQVRWPIDCAARRSTPRSAAATRPAASTRRRPPAAKRTARSRPGTSKAREMYSVLNALRTQTSASQRRAV